MHVPLHELQRTQTCCPALQANLTLKREVLARATHVEPVMNFNPSATLRVPPYSNVIATRTDVQDVGRPAPFDLKRRASYFFNLKHVGVAPRCIGT